MSTNPSHSQFKSDVLTNWGTGALALEQRIEDRSIDSHTGSLLGWYLTLQDKYCPANWVLPAATLYGLNWNISLSKKMHTKCLCLPKAQTLKSVLYKWLSILLILIQICSARKNFVSLVSLLKYQPPLHEFFSSTASKCSDQILS